MVVLLTTFGEVLPMTLAVKYPERVLAIVGLRRPSRGSSGTPAPGAPRPLRRVNSSKRYFMMRGSMALSDARTRARAMTPVSGRR
mgnify:CR=1 FL=1